MKNNPGYPACVSYPWGPNYNHAPCKDYETTPLLFRTETEVGDDGKRTLYLMPRTPEIGHCFLKAVYRLDSYPHSERANDWREKIEVLEGQLHILYITDNGSGLDICDRESGESWYSGANELVGIYGTRAEAELFKELYPETAWPETI